MSMLRTMPFAGNHPVILGFGDRPDLFRRIRVGETPLAGHPGIDFEVPTDTPVLAVQHGVVLETRDDAQGYGKSVLLGHRWGQTFYGHLSGVEVEQGQQIGAGQQIGRSGATGKVDGPALHFGLRLIPYCHGDAWCGFVDPSPYLARLEQPRGAIIGPHIIASIRPHLEILARWQPRLITVLDPTPDELLLLRDVCPNSAIVARIHVPDQELEGRIRANPQEAAVWADALTRSRMASGADYWQIANEALQGPDDLPLLNVFELKRMQLADAAGYRCGILAFSVGNPDLPDGDRMAVWRNVYPALAHAEAHGHVVVVHQYGMPDLWGPNNAYDWYIYRLEHQVLRRLPFRKLKFAVTEYGIDGLIRGDEPAGWQTFTTPEGYVEQLLKCGRYLERFSGQVLGYSIFTLGHYAPWNTYDISGKAATYLADLSEKGTWREIDAQVYDIIPRETDTVTDPGPTIIEREVEVGETDDDQDGTLTPPEEEKPLVEQRIAPAFAAYNMAIKSIVDRPDHPALGDFVYVVKDIFTTHYGSWEPNAGDEASVPEWAREAYLRKEFLEAGADHHLFAAIVGPDGEFIKNHEVAYWSDGYDRLGDSGYTGYLRERTKDSSGWANLFMAGGSSFVPQAGETGPWCWAPAGASEVIVGGGLPLGHPVSTFVIWQAVTRADWEAVNGEQPVVEPEPEEPPVTEEPGDGGAPAEPPAGGGAAPVTVEKRLSEWIDYYNLSVLSIAQRPDNPTGDVHYVVKDIFTTRSGSWEPDELTGSVPQWARDDYLKPVGDPAYFDDAGGDHHLFAAVIGLDGKLKPAQEVLYWSDGFEMLGDPGYTAYIRRRTKDGSGWANIVIGPGSSYVPERAESGPWCWAPAGAAEVVSGGGLPANHHISFFVVWQAVSADTGGAGEDQDERDHTIFLPETPASVQPAAATTAPVLAADLDAAAMLALRQAVWNRLGIEYHADSILAAYARRQSLGMPVTQEFVSGGYRIQGFQGGIVYAPDGEWNRVSQLSW